MLRTFGPGCNGALVDPARQKIPAGATWIDLEEPTSEEEGLVERCVGVDVPTQAELKEIEPSSRLFERGDTIYVTVSALTGITDGEPKTTPIAFVLADNRLVTVRYDTPKPILSFMNHVEREPDLAADAPTALVRLLDAFIDRLADELEALSASIETVSNQIFDRKIEARRIPADKLTQLLTQIGWFQTLLAKIRYSAVSTSRGLNFLASSSRFRADDMDRPRGHLASLITDVSSLSEHATFLSDNLTFLLDASLGLISIEQNAAMKLFSWAAVVFLPPTLIAGIYGMNFHYFPQLDWHYGFDMSLAAMLASAVLPYAYFKWRRWI